MNYKNNEISDHKNIWLQKYIKYKQKYLLLKKQNSNNMTGGFVCDISIGEPYYFFYFTWNYNINNQLHRIIQI